MPPIKLFISHCEQADRTFAAAIAAFMLGGLKIGDDEIRCTSNDNHSLKVGANTSVQLLEELRTAPACIGVISPAVHESAWVVTELGVRLGVNKHLACVLHPDANFDCLPGPHLQHFAVAANDRAKMLNLLDEVGEEIGSQKRTSVRVDKAIDDFLASIKTLPTRTLPTVATPAAAFNAVKVETYVKSYYNQIYLVPGDVLRSILACGPFADVLRTVLDTQEAVIRDALRRETDPHYPYQRDYVQRLSNLIIDIVSENLAESEPIIERFTRQKHDTSQRLGGSYGMLFRMQTIVLATVIRDGFGKPAIPMLTRILSEYPDTVSALVPALETLMGRR